MNEPGSEIVAMNRPAFTLRFETPSIETCRRLRVGAGMSDKSVEAAARGLPGTLFAVQVIVDDVTVGMGRVIGDGGCFYQVVDIVVLPGHQRRGNAKQIMRAIVDYLEDHVPPTGYVSLMAVGKADALYAQFGFVPSAPVSAGMIYRPVR